MVRPNPALSRSQRVLSTLAGNPSSAPNILSKAEQLRIFRERTKDTAWVDDLIPNATNENAKFWLQTIKERGFKGAFAYHAAMTKLEREFGS